MKFKQIGPKKYHMEKEWLEMADEFCIETGASYEITDNVDAIKECDIVYVIVFIG